MTGFRLFFYILISVLTMAGPVAAGGFEARFAGQQTVDGENGLAVTFSKDVDARQDFSPYLKLETKEGDGVDGAWILAKDPRVAYFTQVEPDTAYVIRIYKGLKSAGGDRLSRDQVYEVSTRSAEPMIAFGSRGFILAAQQRLSLPVDSMNINRADIDFFRVRPESQAEFREKFRSDRKIYAYRSRDLARVADLVYTGRWDLEIKKDLRTQVNIPISHIKELKRPGIYFAVLRGAGHYDYAYNTTWFTVSDLGVHARVYTRSIHFYVQSLETAQPLNKARVQGFDKKGHALFDRTTDKGGRAEVAGRFDALSLVCVTRGDHTSLLPMDVPGLDLSEFKTGRALFRPVDLFVYGPRDIYRPGEMVVLDGILRNQDGKMTPGVPIKARVTRPDGRVIREFTWNPGAQNHFHTRFQLPANSLTGTWKVAFSHGAGALEPYSFLVSEFLPERMKLEIEQEGEKRVMAEASLKVRVQGDFLYGAPAAGSRAQAQVHIKPARELFGEKWPGYEFGHISSLINTSFTTGEIRLDDLGRGTIPVENKWGELTSPHWVTANVSLYDSGGRPVVRNRSWQVWPATALVGIRSLSGTPEDPGQVPNDGTAEFEVILTDTQGELLGGTGLEARVIREHREYYWEFKNNEWHWGFTSQFYPVDRFFLDIEAGSKARVAFPVQWGGYRLEVTHPETGLTTSRAVWAGWRRDSVGQGEMNRPDRVDITLDRPAYGPGEKARVLVRAPQGGQGFLFVDGDENLLTLPISLPPEGKEFEIPIDPDWNRHDLHISALVIRPGESRTARLPKRSLGLVPLILDRSDRRLGVEILAPDRSEPNQGIEVAVDLKTPDGKVPSNAWVTLAAVDVGILNLTGFKTPSPFDYFFQTRKYRVRLLDIYQKLIEANKGADARHRFGGDAPVLTRGGDRPATDVRILALHHRAVRTDETGRARFHLDIPDLDGRIRLMAVAHTKNAFGAGEKDMILASPLVVQATMPRFLACGDKAQMVLDFHNLTPDSQTLTLAAAGTGPVEIGPQGPGFVPIDLAPGEKTMIRLDLAAGMRPGRAGITCRIKGLQTHGKTRDLTKTWFLETRFPTPPITRAFKYRLGPGETMALAEKSHQDLVPQTLVIRAGLDSEPPINLGDHLGFLMAYPYGCLEQTVSGLFPHVLLSADLFSRLGLASGSGEETGAKISLGIQRIMEKQKSSGGFGLWDSDSPESPWLTAYAAHFLVNAQEAGFEVPPSCVKRTLERLITYVRRPNTVMAPGYVDKKGFRASVRAYAAFVLARTGSLGLGDARTVWARVRQQGKGPLAMVHAGVALGLAGDRHGAKKAFDLAIKTGREDRVYIGDYGSGLRDFAAGYYLLATYFPGYKNRALFLHELEAALADREWLSTQERNSLVMAGAAKLEAKGRPWQADLTVKGRTGTYSGDRPGHEVFSRGVGAGGFGVKNTGSSDLYLDLVLAGYPNVLPAPQAKGVKIQRRFLDIRGKKTDVSRVKSGDRIIVELTVTPEKRMPNGLVVDMVPAGVELEDPNLSGAFLINDILVDKKRVGEWESQYRTVHTEYRDDRFVAALELRAGQTARIFYPVRVVSPGRFRVPPSLVEDMYRPWIRGIGRTIPWMEVSGR